MTDHELIELLIESAIEERRYTGPLHENDRGWPGACANGEARPENRIMTDYRCVGCVVALLAALATSPWSWDLELASGRMITVHPRHAVPYRQALYAAGFLGGAR